MNNFWKNVLENWVFTYIFWVVIVKLKRILFYSLNIFFSVLIIKHKRVNGNGLKSVAVVMNETFIEWNICWIGNVFYRQYLFTKSRLTSSFKFLTLAMNIFKKKNILKTNFRCFFIVLTFRTAFVKLKRYVI